jgi:uncharacterized protein
MVKPGSAGESGRRRGATAVRRGMDGWRRSNPFVLRRRTLAVVCAVVVMLAGAAWYVGGSLVAPQSAAMPSPPVDLDVRTVRIPVPGATYVVGWWHVGTMSAPSVLLLHGVRANRLAMLDRARLLSARGYSVLMIDLPAHGESPGRAITLGLDESRGVVAAHAWLRAQRPTAKVGVVGVSLGGASVLLGPQPCRFDAVVLEAVYPDVHRAIVDRLRMRIGALAPVAAPVLEWQLRPRLGISADVLRPIDRIAALGAPVLIVAGGRDRHTPIDESLAMYARARSPKALWVLPNAAHEDFLARDPIAYRTRVLGFLDAKLQTAVPSP